MATRAGSSCGAKSRTCGERWGRGGGRSGVEGAVGGGDGGTACGANHAPEAEGNGARGEARKLQTRQKKNAPTTSTIHKLRWVNLLPLTQHTLSP